MEGEDSADRPGVADADADGGGPARRGEKQFFECLGIVRGNRRVGRLRGSSPAPDGAAAGADGEYSVCPGNSPAPRGAGISGEGDPVYPFSGGAGSTPVAGSVPLDPSGSVPGNLSDGRLCRDHRIAGAERHPCPLL